MISNRSVPASALLPHIAYRDVEEAIGWLTDAFGISEHYRYGAPGQPVSGAQMRLEDAWIMLKRAGGRTATPSQAGYSTQSLTIFVEDVERHFENAKGAGVRILEDLHETEYGELQYGAEDLGGHHWLFSRHARDVDPADWGATVRERIATAPRISPMLAVSGARAAIAFYEAAFGARVLWRIDSDQHVVAGLSVEGAPIFLADEAPSFGTRGPAAAGFTTVRIELFVDDPAAMQARAIAAGATERSPVIEHSYSMAGPLPIRRMLQGAVIDPFGHLWLIGKVLE